MLKDESDEESGSEENSESEEYEG
uniref:Uncharacterized protein n=1 Tax=Acrobeloides nanus TaxID=290746 RepID=A0A914EIL2_9BILA